MIPGTLWEPRGKGRREMAAFRSTSEGWLFLCIGPKARARKIKQSCRELAIWAFHSNDQSLLCVSFVPAGPWARTLSTWSSLSSQGSCKVSITHILQIRNLAFREVKQLAQDHAAFKREPGGLRLPTKLMWPKPLCPVASYQHGVAACVDKWNQRTQEI